MKTIVLTIYIALASASLYAANTGENRFIWNEANALMLQAQTPADFLEAAEVYRRLERRGIYSAPLFYNLGSALLLAENYSLAEKYLTRAERYSGTTWEIRRNLTLAIRAGDSISVELLPWYRYPLFWHYGASLNLRIDIAIIAYILFWVAMTPRCLGFKSSKLSSLAITALATAIIFATSATTTINQEHTEETMRLPLKTEVSPSGVIL